jgi:hypothetical protein
MSHGPAAIGTHHLKSHKPLPDFWAQAGGVHEGRQKLDLGCVKDDVVEHEKSISPRGLLDR